MSPSVPLAFALDAPLFLLLLLIIPIGLYAIHAARLRRRRGAIRMPATATLRAVVAAQPSHRRWLPVALLAVTVALLSVALTRPEVTVSSPVDRSSVMLVIDSSGSMLAEDVQPNRMEAARTAAKNFVKGVSAPTRVGVVGYAATPYVVQEPSTDRKSTNQALDTLFASDATATEDALSVALDAIRAEGDAGASNGRRPPGAIILLSDGTPSEGQQPLLVAAAAKQARVPIYTVSLGSPGATALIGGEQRSAEPDPELMRQIAQDSGGESFNVSDAGELDKIYESLGSRVATEAKQREVTAGFAGGAIVAMALALGLGLKWRGRVA